jgi:hypothetical protein
LILIVYFNLLGAQIPVLNNLQSWQLHDCLGSIEFCSNQCGSYDDKPNCCIVCDLCHSHVCQWFRPMQLWSRNNCKHMFCHCQKFSAPSMQAQTNSNVLKPYAPSMQAQTNSSVLKEWQMASICGQSHRWATIQGPVS